MLSSKTSENPFPVIDLHAHAVMESSMGAAGAAGPELGEQNGQPFFRVGDYRLEGVKYRGSAFMDPHIRVAGMDRAGIDLQMLSPNPITYFNDLESRAAAEFSKAQNDALAETVAQYPDRLLGAAQLPMQDTDLAIKELHRSVGDLGLVGAYIDTSPSSPLDSARLDEFYNAVAELNVPLFIHPTPTGSAGLPDDSRLRRFDLDLLLGFSYDETLAVAALIFGGVLERHPNLDICLSHGGGVLAFVAGRFSRAIENRRPWVPEFLIEHGLEHYLERLWFDTHVHSRGALDLLVDTVGTDKLVYGTNFAGWDSDESTASEELGDLAPTVSANAQKLLRL